MPGCWKKKWYHYSGLQNNDIMFLAMPEIMYKTEEFIFRDEEADMVGEIAFRRIPR